MLSRLLARLGVDPKVARSEAPPAPPPEADLAGLYPPNDGTVPIVDPSRLLAHHRQVVEDIYQASGLEKQLAQVLLGKSVYALAAHTLTLPATRDAFFAGKGGLFRLSLDTSLATARKAQVAEFSGLGKIEQRRRETMAWRVACILGALCYDIHRVSSLFIVTAPNGATWAPLRQSLWEFAGANDARQVSIAWRDKTSSPTPTMTSLSGQLAVNAALVSQIVAQEALQYMYDGDQDILTQFYAVISGVAHAQPANRVRPIVEDMRARVIAADEASDPLRFGSRGVGTSLGPYFADGLRQLRMTGRWTVNDERGRVWCSRDGVFLIWPVAAKEIQELLQGANLPGIPRDERTIAEMLRDCGIIAARTAGRDLPSMLWRIRVPNSREITALKLASPSILFPEGELPPLAEVVLLTMGEVAAERPLAPAPSSPESTASPVPLPTPPKAVERPTAPASAVAQPATGLDAAMKALDPAGLAFAKELARTISNKTKRPKGAMKLNGDGSLAITCDHVDKVGGMGVEPIARKLLSAGWLVGGPRDFIRKDGSGTPVIVIEPRIARLLLGDAAEQPDLLSGVSAEGPDGAP